MRNNLNISKQNMIYDLCKSISDLSNEAVIIFDSNNRIIDANSNFANMCGIKTSQWNTLSTDKLFSNFETETLNPFEIILQKLNKEKTVKDLNINMMSKGIKLSCLVNAQKIKDSESDKQMIVSFWKLNDEKEYSKQKDDDTKRKYKTLLDNLRGFSFRCLVDKNWTMEFVSFAFTDITGYETDEIINNNKLSYNDLILPEDRQRVWGKVNAALENKSPYEISYRLKSKSGDIRIVEEQGVGIYQDDSKKPIAIEGYINDITEKINERNALIKSETLNRSITQTAADAIITINSLGLINSWNTAATDIFGYSKNESIGKKITKLIPEAIELIEKSIDNPSESEELKSLIGHTIELSAIHKNSELIPIELSLSKYEFADELFFTVIVRDISIRKRNEFNLKKLSTAVKHSPSVIVITDREGNIEYANPKFTELTKYSLKEVIGKNPRILNSGEQSKEFYQNMWDTILSGNIWKGEVHNRKKTGELFWERVSISPIYNERNEISSFIKIAEDITQQHLDLIKLQKSEESYRKLIATTSEGFWLINNEGKTTLVNKSLCEMLGYTEQEMLGKTPYDFVNDENLKIFKFQITQNRTKKQRLYEIELLRKDGRSIDALFSATTILDHEDNYMGSFAFVRDISEQKRSQLIQKILYNISKANTISDNLQTLISIIQKEVGKVVDTTNFYVALYDEKNNILSFPFYSDKYDSFYTASAEKTLSKYVIDTEKPLLADINLKKELKKKGILDFIGTRSKVWMGVPMKNQGKVFGVFAVQNYDDENAYSIKDLEIMEIIADQISISIHRKKGENDLREALERAKESDKLKSAFLQNISHEIRTPMNGLLGFTSLLKNTKLSVEEQQEYIDIIMESGNRLLNTFDDIMNISMIETGQVIISASEFNVNKELQKQHDLHNEEALVKGLELNMYQLKDDSNISLKTDYEKFNSILTYLIRNAIKYTFKGKIEVGYSNKENYLEFFIKDSGIGIPKSRLDAIFDIFVQADLSEVKAKEGSGLGLSITKAYVEMLGGKIWAESEEGKGSCFYFTIPYNNPVTKTDEKKKKEAGNLKILIVEDEEFSSEYLKVILEEYASEFLEANNGKEAIELTKNNPDIDIIFMDLLMPIVNGYTATREIRSFNKKVKIVAQTAYALQGDSTKALQAGCDEYISKPIDKKELISIVDKLIQEINKEN